MIQSPSSYLSLNFGLTIFLEPRHVTYQGEDESTLIVPWYAICGVSTEEISKERPVRMASHSKFPIA